MKTSFFSNFSRQSSSHYQKWLFCIVVLLLSSCNTEQVQLSENAQSQYSEKVNLPAAIKIAEAMEFTNPKTPNKSNARVGDEKTKEVANSLTIKNEEDPALYIFNYKGGGFLILSATEKYYPVLAKSEANAVDISNAPPQFKEWLEFTKNAIKKVAKSEADFEDKDQVQALWANLKRMANLPSPRNGKIAIDCEDPIFIPVQIGPLINTAWGQRCGYNDLTPIVQNGCGGCATNNNALTGCVATAMAQVMRFWSHPNNYNWAGMNVAAGTAVLMRDIGAAVGMNYWCGLSGATYPNANAAFNNVFQYPASQFNNSYSRNVVVGNLNQNRPVLLGGVNSSNLGHAWVCDGYRIERQCNYDTYYMWMNWGWDGDSNGWYHDSNFEGYNYNRQSITNIHP